MASEIYSFERYLNVRMAYGPSFSPDGRQVSFLTDITGVAEVWRVPVDMHLARPSWPEQLTFRAERVAGAAFSPKGNTLLVSADVGGNERTQLFALSGDGSSFVPLTDKPEVIYQFGDWSPDGERIAYASNERDARYFDVYERNMQSGEVKPVLVRDVTIAGVRYSPDGKHLIMLRVETNTRNQLWLFDLDTGEERLLTPALDTTGPAWFEAAAWSADRRGLYLLSNYQRQFHSLAYLDLATTELTYLSDTIWDVERLAVSSDGKHLATVINEDGYSLLEIFDVSQGWGAQKSLPTPTLPGGVINEIQWSQDGQLLAITFVTADDSSDVWIWDVEQSIIWRATQSALGGIPRNAFVRPTVVRYPTFDGREIPAFLYLPRGEQHHLPVVVYVHGGPEGQSLPTFNAVIQYLVSRGYGVLAPNVRGSTGYGYEYQSLDDVRLRMDSVNDLQYAALWLRESGIADPQRIAVMGGSYGGFMVLSAVTTYPDLWAAGVDIVGIANFVTFLENTGPWRRKLRETEYGSLEHDREFLEQISPIRHVERMKAPMFVVHGANDPRVPVGEAEQIVAALRARNVPVDYLRFADEGHGLVKRANRLIAYPAIARFLDEHIGS